MAGTTARGLHRPIGSDPYEPATAISRLTDPTDEGILADTIEARMVSCAPTVDGSRPTAGTARRLHHATDTGDWSYDNGSAWVPLASTARACYSSGGSYAVPVAGAVNCFPLGTETEDTYGFYTKAAFGAGGHAITPALPGLYRVSYQVSGIGGATLIASVFANHGTVVSGVTDTQAGAFLDLNQPLGLVASGSALLRVAVSEKIWLGVAHASGTGNAEALSFQVERVGP